MFFTHTREFEAHSKELLAVVEKCLRSSSLILGEHVQNFEARFAKSCGVPYGIGVASGTDAIILALKALKIGPGDEIITMSNTAVPTIAAVRSVGATPVFIDIDPETLLMDLKNLEKAITKKTKVILPVHLYGNPVPMTDVLTIAKAKGIKVIEDAAQAYGASFNGSPVGSFGDLGCFSFYPTKNLGAWGDGGMCVTKNEEYAESLRALRQYGFRKGAIAEVEGMNSRLDELQAAVLIAKMEYFEENQAKRTAIASRYDEALKSSKLHRPKVTKGGVHSHHLYVVQAEDRAKAQKIFQEHEVDTLIHYPTPIHLMPAYAFLGYKAGSLPVTEEAAAHIFSLPLYPYLNEEEIRSICDCILSFV